MAIEPPPSYTAPPADLPIRGQRATFSARVDAWVTWFSTVILVQLAAMIANAYNNALSAFSSATAAKQSENNAAASATAALSTAGANVWNPATNYALYTVVWSPIDLLTYRRRVAGTTPTDPSLDSINWRPVSGLNRAQLHAAALYF